MRLDLLHMRLHEVHMMLLLLLHMLVGLFHVEFGFRNFLLGFCASFCFCAVATGKCPFCFARLIFLFGYVGFAQLFAFFVWLSRFFCFCFSRGRDNFLVGLWEFCFNVRPLPI